MAMIALDSRLLDKSIALSIIKGSDKKNAMMRKVGCGFYPKRADALAVSILINHC